MRLSKAYRPGSALLAFVALLLAAGRATAASITEDTGVFTGRDKPIGRLAAGAHVSVLEESGEWMKIRYETMDASFEGYVRRTVVDTRVSAVAPMPAGVDPVAPAAVAPEPVATPPVAEPVATPPPVSPRVTTGPEMALNSHWQIQSKSGGILADDFAALLRDLAKPQVNLVAQKNHILFKELYYMMPVADALKQYGQAAVSPEPVKTPGFPSDSFKAYTFDPKLENVTRLTLVADLKGQLVAVQVSDSGSKELWLYRRINNEETALNYSENLRLYDIIGGRTKGSSNWRVGAARQQKGGVVEIDTELITGNPDYSESVKSKERVRLILPQPVADLCAHLLASRK